MTTADLLRRWHEDADRLAAYGAADQAAVLRQCAEQLASAELPDPAHDLVSLPEAAQLSGYSVPHLRRLLRAGRLRDQATTGPVRLRRGDLPRKAPPLHVTPGPLHRADESTAPTAPTTPNGGRFADISHR